MAGVRLDGELHFAGARHLFEDVQRGLGPRHAVDADDIGTGVSQLARDRRGLFAHPGAAVALERHLHDEGNVLLHFTDGFYGLPGFGERRERLQHDQVDATVDEHLRLLGERLVRLLQRDVAAGGQPNADRPNRARDERMEAAVARRFARYRDAGRVDLSGLLREVERAQPQPVCAEGVRLDNLGARRQVLGMHSLDELRVREVLLVEAD